MKIDNEFLAMSAYPISLGIGMWQEWIEVTIIGQFICAGLLFITALIKPHIKPFLLWLLTVKDDEI